jgi:membrane protease YdiL (CAAX protease family)
MTIQPLLKKILIHPIFRIIAGVLLLNVGLFILRNLSEALLSAIGIEERLVAASVIFLIRISGLAGLYWLFVHLYEKRKPLEIFFTWSSAAEFGIGALIGIICLGSVVGINMLAGWVTLAGIHADPDLLEGFYDVTFFVLLQDFVFFMILFRIAEPHLGTWATIILTGLIFGFKHLLFPGYTFISGVFIFLESTFIFSALFLRSRALWGIFGFHLLYNLAQMVLFGHPVSEGLQSILDTRVDGPLLFTGNPSGFESSVITGICCIAAGAILLTGTYRKGGFIENRRKPKF